MAMRSNPQHSAPKRFSGATRYIIRGVLLAILACYAVWSGRYQSDQNAPPPVNHQDSASESVVVPGEMHYVQRVVDGDTFVLQDRTRVRMIGVNTPETVKENHPVEPWGPEASAMTKQLIEGQTVRLEYDVERTDQYDRDLAYVWYKDPASGQEKLLNEELIRAGLGRATLRFNFSEAMKQRYREAQAEAQKAQRGIWSAPAGKKAA